MCHIPGFIRTPSGRPYSIEWEYRTIVYQPKEVFRVKNPRFRARPYEGPLELTRDDYFRAKLEGDGWREIEEEFQFLRKEIAHKHVFRRPKLKSA